MKAVLKYIDNTSEWAGRIVSYLLPVVMIVIAYEVIMRYVFVAPTKWANETYIFMCVPVYFLGGAYVLRHRGHINMDIVYARLPLRWRATLDLITFPIFLIFFGALLWFGIDFFWSSFKIGEITNSEFGPPVWPVKFILPFGAFLILLQGLANFARILYTVVTGRSMT